MNRRLLAAASAATLVAGTLALGVLAAAPSAADTLTGTCTQAAFVDGASKTLKGRTNNTADLWASASRPQYTYVGCTVAGLPTDATGVTATLDLTGKAGGAAGTVRGHVANAAFDETTLTFNNQPGFNATVTGSAAASATTVTALPVPIAGNGTYWYAVDTTQAQGILFASDETAIPPKLTVTYSPATPSPTPTTPPPTTPAPTTTAPPMTTAPPPTTTAPPPTTTAPPPPACVADATVTIAPGEMAAKLLDVRTHNRAGRSVCVQLTAGATYREILGFYADGSQTSARITVEGNGAIITGADPFTLTSNGAGRLTTPWTYNLGNLADPWPTLSYPRVLLNREALFIGDTPYYVTDDPATPVVGTFYVNESTDRITVNPRPEHAAATTAEVTVRRKIVEVANRSVSPITIRNLTVQRGYGAVQENIFDVTNSANLTIENVEVRQAAGGGMGLCCGSNYVLRNVRANSNGVASLGTYQVNGFTADDTSMTLNNWRGAQAGFFGWATGSKLLSTNPLTINRWTSTKNLSHGFWMDSDVRNGTVNDLVSAGNTGRGMFIEKNPGPIVFDRATVCDNGYGGISWARSDYVTLRNSKVFDNVGWQHFHTGNTTPYTLSDGTVVRGDHLTLTNNITRSIDDAPANESLGLNWLYWNNRSEASEPGQWTTLTYSGNTWWHALRTNPFRLVNVSSTYAQFAALTGETGGQFADPGVLTCPAPRPPAQIDFATGW